MKVRTGLFCTFLGLGIGLFAAQAKSEFMPSPQFRRAPTFKLLDQPVSNAAPPSAAKRSAALSGSSIAATANGALVVDPDSGTLILTDKVGSKVASLRIGSGATQVVVDRTAKRAYVADRNGDRIVVVDLTKGLVRQREITTDTEPYGLALTPDHKTLLVTTVADHSLAGYDTRTGKQRWSMKLPPEPRGVAVSPDGREATVGFLTTGAIARVSLRRGRVHGSARYVTIERPQPTTTNRFRSLGNRGRLGRQLPHNRNAGRVFARNAFAVVYIGHHMVVVPHQQSTPVQASVSENRGSYGGGANPPIEHRLAFVARRNRGRDPVAVAQIALHQPRGAVYDPGLDRLFVSGYGSDEILMLNNVSQPTIKFRSVVALPGHNPGCGPTGLALSDSGVLLVHCSLSRRVARLDPNKWTNTVVNGPELIASSLTVLQQKGRNLFRKGKDFRMSTRGAMACESCHPEVRTDGLSWRIAGKILQTPLLGGRLVGTHPFKWDGGDKTLAISLRSTVTRLGGRGITTNDAKALAAFLQNTTSPRHPKPTSKRAVARGKTLFHSKALKCGSCHSGNKLTNRKSYDLAANMKRVDTPSLVGLASSAPYYHDGSAVTLRALLLENGTVHGMGKLKHLTARNVDDLVAYLQTL